MSPTPLRRTLAAVAATALSLTLAACGTDTPDEPTTEDTTAEATPDDGAGLSGELLVWAWDPGVEPVAEAFMEANPDVTIEVVNAGTGNDHYTAVQNAVAAGSGIPDVAQMEYYALGQFSLAGSLADLSALGASELDGTFTPGPWNAVTQGGTGVFGLPMDSGPMAMFYNAELFEEHGLEVPTTWEQYLEVARELKEKAPDSYMANDAGDAGFTTSMIWQAGGQPYTVDGTTVGIDFTDEGTTQFAELWNQMLTDELVAPISSWSDEWYQGLGDGTIATLTIGAWMPGNLVSGVPDGAGKWRVAPMPQWEEGGSASSENGGSAISVMEASQNKELAYEFLEFTTIDEGVGIRIDGGAFPSTTAELESEEFLSAEFEYFGGQTANEVFADSAANVVEGWTYLPFQVYSNSIFNDHVGAAYSSNGATTIAEGLEAWAQASKEYGQQQGFTIE